MKASKNLGGECKNESNADTVSAVNSSSSQPAKTNDVVTLANVSNWYFCIRQLTWQKSISLLMLWPKDPAFVVHLLCRCHYRTTLWSEAVAETMHLNWFYVAKKRVGSTSAFGAGRLVCYLSRRLSYFSLRSDARIGRWLRVDWNEMIVFSGLVVHGIQAACKLVACEITWICFASRCTFCSVLCGRGCDAVGYLNSPPWGLSLCEIGQEAIENHCSVTEGGGNMVACKDITKSTAFAALFVINK